MGRGTAAALDSLGAVDLTVEEDLSAVGKDKTSRSYTLVDIRTGINRFKFASPCSGDQQGHKKSNAKGYQRKSKEIEAASGEIAGVIGSALSRLKDEFIAELGKLTEGAVVIAVRQLIYKTA